MTVPRCSRRSVLAAGFTAVGASLAGCPDGPQSNETTGSRLEALGIETPEARACEPTEPPRPQSPVAGFSPKSYPAYPGDLSIATAGRFAAAYEQALRFNRYLAEDAGSDTRRLSVRGRVREEVGSAVGDGFLVGVTGELSVQRSDDRRGTERLIVAENPFGAWYYLTEHFALRQAVDEGSFPDEPESFDSATVVACRGELRNRSQPSRRIRGVTRRDTPPGV